MPKSTGFLETIKTRLQIAVTEVPFVLRHVLGHEGWGNWFFDVHDQHGSVTCDKKKLFKRTGLSLSMEHHLEAKWRADGDDNQVYLRVEIVDHDGQTHTNQLKDDCAQILRAVFNRADEIKASGPPKPKTTYGTAHWATAANLEEAGFICTEDDPKRLVLGKTDDDRPVAAPADVTVMHAIVAGPTGSGKTSRVLIPNLLKRAESSVIITEATAGNEKPDLYFKTSGYRRAHGSSVYYFNPDDLESDRINPVDQIRTVDDVIVLADLIFENTSKEGGGGDKFWQDSEKQLLTSLLLHGSSQKASLADVRLWLTLGQDGMKEALTQSPVEKAKSEYMAFHSSGTENTRNGVIVGLMMRLNLWISPRIAALTSTTDVDMDNLQKDLFAFYLAVPSDKNHVKPLAALIFSYLLNKAQNSDFEKPLFLLLDEFTNFGRIPGFDGKISIIRHRDISVILGFQNYEQLEQVYKSGAANLWKNTLTKVLFKPNPTDLDMAKRMSEMLGKQTVYTRKVSSSGQINEDERGRFLLEPDEVLTLQSGYALCFNPISSCSPFKLKNYAWQEFVNEMAVPPPPKPKVEVDERLIRTCEKASMTPDWQTEWVATNPEKELNYMNANIADTRERPEQERVNDSSAGISRDFGSGAII
jgi:type IV secretion system protein VirD4